MSASGRSVDRDPRVHPGFVAGTPEARVVRVSGTLSETADVFGIHRRARGVPRRFGRIATCTSTAREARRNGRRGPRQRVAIRCSSTARPASNRLLRIGL